MISKQFLVKHRDKIAVISITSQLQHSKRTSNPTLPPTLSPPLQLTLRHIKSDVFDASIRLRQGSCCVLGAGRSSDRPVPEVHGICLTDCPCVGRLISQWMSQGRPREGSVVGW